MATAICAVLGFVKITFPFRFKKHLLGPKDPFDKRERCFKVSES